jgi:hypothetical protein
MCLVDDEQGTDPSSEGRNEARKAAGLADGMQDTLLSAKGRHDAEK